MQHAKHFWKIYDCWLKRSLVVTNSKSQLGLRLRLHRLSVWENTVFLILLNGEICYTAGTCTTGGLLKQCSVMWEEGRGELDLVQLFLQHNVTSSNQALCWPNMNKQARTPVDYFLTSIHPSIISCLFRVGSRWQQVRKVVQETNFRRSSLQSYSFGHYPKLKHILERRLINWEFLQRSSINTTIVCYNVCITADTAPVACQAHASFYPHST